MPADHAAKLDASSASRPLITDRPDIVAVSPSGDFYSLAGGYLLPSGAEHHDHLTAFKFRHGLNFGNLAGLVAHFMKQFHAQILVSHFAAPKTHGHFYLVALIQRIYSLNAFSLHNHACRYSDAF